MKLIMISLLATNVLVACSGQTTSEDIKSLVHDYSTGNMQNQNASITSQELIVTDSEGKQNSFDLPEEEFFVSIAPYINETHP